MPEVVNIKWVTVGGQRWPEYVEVTLASGEVRRYRADTGKGSDLHDGEGMSLTLKDLRVLTGKKVVVAVARNDDMVPCAEHRPATTADIVEALKNEGAEEAESLGVRFYDVPEGKDALILAVESRGWRLEPGRYLVFRLDEEE